MPSSLGLLGVALVQAPGFLWAVLLGFGLGMMFTLLLTLPTDLSNDPREVGGASALMLLVGYLLAALAPSVLGAVRGRRDRRVRPGNLAAGRKSPW